jgi:hypothetical protein
MARPFYVEYAAPVSIALIIGGIIGTILGMIDFLYSEMFDIGGWGFYLLGLALLSLIVGIFMLWGFVKRVRHLKKLLLVKSKKELLSVLDDLEYTAWRLPSKYDKDVSQKKKGFELK